MMGDREELKAVQALRELVEGDKRLYIGNPADETILRLFLNLTDFNVNEAFEKIKLWFRLKAENSEFYAFKRDPNVHDPILKKGIQLVLPERDQLGRRVYLLKPANSEYGVHEPHQLSQVDDLWITLALQEEETQRNGLVSLLDMDNFPWKFLRYLTPRINRITTAKAESIPLRHIQYHVINAGILINAIIQLVFPFLSQATKEQIFFHKSLGSLHGHISPACLPPEYGGTAPPLDPPRLVREYLDPYTDRLNELLSYRYTENLLE